MHLTGMDGLWMDAFPLLFGDTAASVVCSPFLAYPWGFGKLHKTFYLQQL